MGQRLILDTNALIACERATIDRVALDADELAIAAVSVAQYRAGIELADGAERAADRARALAAGHVDPGRHRDHGPGRHGVHPDPAEDGGQRP